MIKKFLLITSISFIAISSSLFAIDPFPPMNDGALPSVSSSVLQHDDLINITNSIAGSFQILKNPITVEQYTAFLNAVAAIKDLHHLYTEEMKGLIHYEPAGWIEPAHYSVVGTQSSQPITFITSYLAMRYCNWREWGSPDSYKTQNLFVYSGNDVTESGAYNFATINGTTVTTPNLNAIYQLPTPDQLKVALPNIVTPLSSFYEWCITDTSSSSDQAEISDRTPIFLLVHDQNHHIKKDPSELLPSTGFRFVKKENLLLSSEKKFPSHKTKASAVEVTKGIVASFGPLLPLWVVMVLLS